ncbi:MAG: TonB-dependent receptor [Siphonobacter sp.]
MRRLLIIVTIFFSLNSFAQDSTIHLSEVTVTANFQATEIRKTARNVSVITAQDIEKAPVKTLDGVLQYALNVDVRSRAPLGVQADISIRGGNFDQTLILVDGIKMNDPQTGHHSLNLPVPMDMIEKIEILQGGDSRVFGPSAFSGVINIITRKNLPNQVRINAAGGQHGLYQLNTGISNTSKYHSTLLAAEQVHSDGYAYNTAFTRNNLYGRTSAMLKKTTFTLQGGYMNNNFGASNFYHPKYSDQYEQVKQNFVIAQVEQRFSDRLISTLTGSWRRHYDMYDFNKYRETNNFSLINFHQTNVWDLEWRNKWVNTWGVTSFGAEWRRESIVSNRLGDTLLHEKEVPGFYGNYYTFGKDRDNYNFYLEQLKRWNHLTVVAGTLFNVNSQFGSAWFPGLDASYSLTDQLNIYASVNRSLRYPTFTEMYLNSSVVIADPTIRPEKAWSYEIGSKRFTEFNQTTLAVFYRQTANAIDKIKYPNESTPRMQNIDNLNTLGAEFSNTFQVTRWLKNEKYWLQRITLNYAYVWADKKQTNFQSFYTLNYLRHKLTLGTNIRVAKNLGLDVWYTLKKREGDYQWDATTAPVPYATIHLVDARLTWSQPGFRFFADCTNLINQSYYEQGFVQQPGRWLSGGVSIVLK